MPKVLAVFFAVFLTFILSSCSLFSGREKLVLRKVDFSQLSGWQEDNQTEALQSFLKSCDKFSSAEADFFTQDEVFGKFGDWQNVCSKAKYGNLSGSFARGFFENNFTPYLALSKEEDKGLFTGYYEIELEGSRTKHGDFKYPLYKKPANLQSGEKYLSRRDIDKGALKGEGLELVWLNDPVRAFFLHVQGSGRIRLDDGELMKVGYAAKNGREYSSIGKYMLDEGFLTKEEISAESIRNWLYSRPDIASDVMQQNESYVFFRELNDSGPIGAQGVPLTPLRSLAVDNKYIPYGVPLWVDVKLTDKFEEEHTNFKKLVVAQDTGSAIRGPVRGDIFFGSGKQAEKLASYSNSYGSYYVLIPNESRL